MLGLKGKRAIVTGAGGGIGNEICVRLASEGCDIALFDINRRAAQQVAAQISSVKTTIHEVDISDYEAVGLINEAVEQLGGLDILVNNAGWDIAQPFLDTNPEFWDRVIASIIKVH